MKLNPSFLLLAPFLLLAGCSHQLYATKLNLPHLDPPAVMTPSVPITGEFKDTVESVRNATAPAQINVMLGLMDAGKSISGIFASGESPEYETEHKHMMAYLEQAAQIKKAELDDGDTKDSTGEVAERLDYVQQCSSNLDFLEKNKPAGASSGAPGSAPAAPAAASAPIPPEEQAWIRDSNAALQQIPESAFDLIGDEKIKVLIPAFQASKAQYDKLIPPPRMSKADTIFKQAYDAGAQGCDLLQQSRAQMDMNLILQSNQKFRDFHDLVNQAHAEIDAVTKGTH